MPARAVVSARGVDTHYLRAGSGQPVVLLAEGDGASMHSVLASLVLSARVIAPLIPAHVPFADWLRDFLDGLGLTDVKLIADQAMASPVLEFAAGERLRVSSVALLVDGDVVPQKVA
jgi:hypothetical protein